MKLKLSRADLVRALQTVAKVIERKTTIPILANVLLRAEAGRLHVTATDLDVMIETSVAADVERPGATTLPATFLSDYARRLPDKAEIGITLDDPKGPAVVRSGRSRVSLAVIDAEDYPNLNAGEMPCTFMIAGGTLSRMFGQAEFAMSTEETRYYLNGVFLHAMRLDDGTDALRVVATDGHRLARIDLPCPAGAETMPSVIVPRKAVAEFRRIAEPVGDATVTVSVSAAKIRVETAETRIVSKLVDGTFPDYQRVIPTGHDKVAVAEVPELAAALDRVGTITSERGRAVACAVDEDGIVLKVRDPSTGDAEEGVACRFDGVPITVGFNGRYAREILAALATETVEIAIASPGDPMLWRSPADASRLYVLMPMRA